MTRFERLKSETVEQFVERLIVFAEKIQGWEMTECERDYVREYYVTYLNEEIGG